MSDEVELKVDDPRLVGWRQERRFLYPSDWRFRVRTVSDVRELGGLFDGRKSKVVYFDIAVGDGDFEPDGLPRIFEPDKQPDLREVGDALSYIRRALSLEDGEDLEWRSLKVDYESTAHPDAKVIAADGPAFSSNDLHSASFLEKHIKTFQSGLWEEAERDPKRFFPLLNAAEAAVRQAYHLGRIMREGELKAEFEPSAAHSLKLPKSGGDGMKAVAARWQVPALNVARAEREKKPSLSQVGVARKIEAANIKGLPGRPQICAVVRGWEGLFRRSGGVDGLRPPPKA